MLCDRTAPLNLSPLVFRWLFACLLPKVFR
jgi:hypothetical protein